MTNLENLKKLAEGLGADASKCSTNLGALNVISKALGGSGDAGTNAEAISDIVGASLDEMASPAMLKGIIDRTVTEVVIPEGTTEIGANAFSHCIALEKVSIPDSVDIIRSSAFSNCQALSPEVKVPNATRFEGSAFGGCFSVKTLYISDRTVFFGKDAFGGMTGLERVYTVSGNGEIPEEVDNNGNAPFGGAMSLVYLEIPEGIRRINTSLCGGCSNLEAVIVHDNLKEIKAGAFGGCSKLKTLKSKSETSTEYDVIFPNGMTTIGDGTQSVFGGCSSITSVYIPSSMESIGAGEFGGSGITKIDIDKPENSISGAPWGASNATVNWLG